MRWVWHLIDHHFLLKQLLNGFCTDTSLKLSAERWQAFLKSSYLFTVMSIVAIIVCWGSLAGSKGLELHL